MKKVLTASLAALISTSAFAGAGDLDVNWHFVKKEVETGKDVKMKVDAFGIGATGKMKDNLEIGTLIEVGKIISGNALIGTGKDGEIKLNYDGKSYASGEINLLSNTVLTMKDNSKFIIKFGIGAGGERFGSNDKWLSVYFPAVITFEDGKFFSDMEFRYYAYAYNDTIYGDIKTAGYGGSLNIGYKMTEKLSISAFAKGKYFDRETSNSDGIVIDRKLKEDSLGVKFSYSF